MLFAVHAAGAPHILQALQLTESAVIAGGNDHDTDKEDSDKKSKSDLVITPGGPRPADQVHTVEPGQKVRRNPDGTYSIIPNDETNTNK